MITCHAKVTHSKYRAQLPPIIAKYGGRHLVRGGAVEVIEGDVDVQFQVILEFPNIAALKASYFSVEYKPMIAIRQRAATDSIVLIEGCLP